MRKQGGIAISLSAIVGMILLVVLLITGITIFKPLFSSDFQYSGQEQVCRLTVALSNYFEAPLIPFKIKPLCKPQLITLNKKLITDYKVAGESEKDATMRFIAEKINRCQKVHNIESRDSATAHEYCYVCYGLIADEKDSLKVSFTPEEFKTHILEAQSPRGRAYFREIMEEGHPYWFKIKTEQFEPAKTDYGVFYIDNVEVSNVISAIGLGAGSAGIACVVGLVFGPFTGTLSTWALCGGAAVFGSKMVIEETFGPHNVDSIVIMELKEAREVCKEIIAS